MSVFFACPHQVRISCTCWTWKKDFLWSSFFFQWILVSPPPLSHSKLLESKRSSYFLAQCSIFLYSSAVKVITNSILWFLGGLHYLCPLGENCTLDRFSPPLPWLLSVGLQEEEIRFFFFVFFVVFLASTSTDSLLFIFFFWMVVSSSWEIQSRVRVINSLITVRVPSHTCNRRCLYISTQVNLSLYGMYTSSYEYNSMLDMKWQ